MRTIIYSSIIAAFLSIGSAFAEEGRFDILLDSPVMIQMQDTSDWRISFAENRLTYRCVTCAGKVGANLTVISPYDVGGFSSYEDRYIPERKIFCSNLVIQVEGRCYSFQHIRMRAGLLSGFRAGHVIDDRTMTEIVLFHNNRYFGDRFGPELIKASIWSEENVPLPDDFSEILMSHMMRLTVFY